MRRARALTASVAAVAAVALALLPVAGASAHDYLVNSDPGAGATVTAPQQQVTLTFNDRVLDLTGDGKSSIIEVTDAAGRYFETGCATTADTVVSAPVALGPAGAYTVTYQVVSADGHTVSNSFPFTYQPPAGTAEAAGSASPTCGQVAVAPSPAPDEAATTPGPTESVTTPAPTKAADDSGNLGLVVGIAVGIVVLALVGVLIVVLTSRRKPASADAEPPTEDDDPVK